LTPLAQTLSGVAAAAGIFAAIVGTLVGALTYLATRKSRRGGDLERLQGTLSTWAQETIADLRRELREEEQQRHEDVSRAEERCRVMVEQLRTEFETKLAEERARGDWWKARAQGADDPDATPPPDAREAR
jgi:flagellar motility protein MotE (MotC chaperone)